MSRQCPIAFILLFCCAATAGAEADRGGDGIHWSLAPLEPPAPPDTASRSPIDAFVAARLEASGLTLSKPASPGAWLRRVYFDLIGLPPSPQDLDAFLSDSSPRAEERVVDRLLASPRHGERWARHWMDTVRYAETHGHDEDAIRENAWPYRDWLIRAFNDDKPYAEFIREQIAGDIISSDDPRAITATGFLACGPWDSSSQMGIQDGTTDKKIAQYLDRDDMLSATMSTFTSTTVHCARCHNHKFDPVPTADYYALQAVFAGVDKVDRPYDDDPHLARKRARLLHEAQDFESLADSPELAEEIADWIESLERSVGQWSVLPTETVASAAGIPFEIQTDGSILFGGTAPETDTYTITGTPGLSRLTAIQLEVMTDPSCPEDGPGRAPNGNLHLSEIQVSADGKDLPIGRAIAGFNQSGWEIDKAVDGKNETAWGIHPEESKPHRAVFVFREAVALPENSTIVIVLKQVHGGSHVIGRPRLSVTDSPNPGGAVALHPEIAKILATPPDKRSRAQQRSLALSYLKQKNARELASLPEPRMVFGVASQFTAIGNFKPAGGPREVHVLNRGDILSPGAPASPGTLACIAGLPARFDLPDPDDEGARRVALADWLAHHDNVLTWRSIVNRVWHYHFGRGIVSTPNDFGRMGASPTHPDLLDWLACEFRARGGRLKCLHKMIVLSDTYRQSTDDRPECLIADAENRLLWRMNLRRLDAESIHDAVLSLSGMLDLTMGGPSARQFHTSKGVHITPVVDYLGFDPDHPANLRRSVYRFVFRTVPDPLMQALDCPDASQLAPRRENSSTALQSLAMLNNRFLVRQSEHIAADLQRARGGLDPQIDELILRAYGRPASAGERAQIAAYAREHGLANACRIIINSSEFLHVH